MLPNTLEHSESTVHSQSSSAVVPGTVEVVGTGVEVDSTVVEVVGTVVEEGSTVVEAEGGNVVDAGTVAEEDSTVVEVVCTVVVVSPSSSLLLLLLIPPICPWTKEPQASRHSSKRIGVCMLLVAFYTPLVGVCLLESVAQIW